MVTLLLFATAAKQLLHGDCDERVFRAYFGIGLDVMADIWDRFKDLSLLAPADLPIHLLWMFFWWKVYPTFDVGCKFAKVCPKTFRTTVQRMQLYCTHLNTVSCNIAAKASSTMTALTANSFLDCRSNGMTVSSTTTVAMRRLPLIVRTAQ